MPASRALCLPLLSAALLPVLVHMDPYGVHACRRLRPDVVSPLYMRHQHHPLFAPITLRGHSIGQTFQRTFASGAGRGCVCRLTEGGCVGAEWRVWTCRVDRSSGIRRGKAEPRGRASRPLPRTAEPILLPVHKPFEDVLPVRGCVNYAKCARCNVQDVQYCISHGT